MTFGIKKYADEEKFWEKHFLGRNIPVGIFADVNKSLNTVEEGEGMLFSI